MPLSGTSSTEEETSFSVLNWETTASLAEGGDRLVFDSVRDDYGLDLLLPGEIQIRQVMAAFRIINGILSWNRLIDRSWALIVFIHLLVLISRWDDLRGIELRKYQGSVDGNIQRFFCCKCYIALLNGESSWYFRHLSRYVDVIKAVPWKPPWYCELRLSNDRLETWRPSANQAVPV